MGQNLHLSGFFRRELASDSGIRGDQTFLLCLFKGGVTGRMAGADHRVGQSAAVPVPPNQPPVFFKFSVELLQIGLRQLIEGNPSEFRDDMLVNAGFITFLCSRADAGLAPRLIPQVDPLSEGHGGLGAGRQFSVQLCAFFFQPVQFFDALGFGTGEDVLCFRQILFVISDDDASFPPPVFSQADGPFSGFSLSSQGFSSFPNRSSIKSPTTAAAFLCISVVTCP